MFWQINVEGSGWGGKWGCDDISGCDLGASGGGEDCYSNDSGVIAMYVIAIRVVIETHFIFIISLLATFFCQVIAVRRVPVLLMVGLTMMGVLFVVMAGVVILLVLYSSSDNTTTNTLAVEAYL